MKDTPKYLIAILFFVAILSTWFYNKLKKVEEQLTKKNSLMASNTTLFDEIERRLKALEDYFE